MSIDFGALVGKTLKSVENKSNIKIVFKTTDGEVYELWDDGEICSNISVEDICCDLDDLIGSPILVAEESTSPMNENPDCVNITPEDQECDELFLWTFYKIDTIKGGVTIRWYGNSNGHYAVSVGFCKIN